MQTFLPYDDLVKSARCLDYRRLGKQRVEAKQILNALQPGSTSGWRNHPAVRMWRGYESALTQYMNVCIAEWVVRGYRNTMPILHVDNVVLPPWFGGVIHASHRSNLLRKDPAFYASYRWTEPMDIPYHWPV
jgi:hypothetical protein